MSALRAREVRMLLRDYLADSLAPADSRWAHPSGGFRFTPEHGESLDAYLGALEDVRGPAGVSVPRARQLLHNYASGAGMALADLRQFTEDGRLILPRGLAGELHGYIEDLERTCGVTMRVDA